MLAVRWIHANIRLRMVLDQHRGRRRETRITGRLCRVGAEIFARCGRPGAGRLAAVSLGRAIAGRIRHLWRVATGPLGGGVDVRDVVGLETARIGRVVLGVLRDLADPRSQAGRSRQRSIEGCHENRNRKGKQSASLQVDASLGPSSRDRPAGANSRLKTIAH